MEQTMKFTYTAENTFSGFSDYEGKHLCSAYIIGDGGNRLLLPKMGKSILSSDDNIIFVHSYRQATATDKMYNDNEMIVRKRMILSFIRFAKHYNIIQYEGTHSKRCVLAFKYEGIEYQLPCRITWVIDFNNKVFKCIIGDDVMHVSPEEEASIAQFSELMMD